MGSSLRSALVCAPCLRLFLAAKTAQHQKPNVSPVQQLLMRIAWPIARVNRRSTGRYTPSLCAAFESDTITIFVVLFLIFSLSLALSLSLSLSLLPPLSLPSSSRWHRIVAGATPFYSDQHGVGVAGRLKLGPCLASSR